MQPRCGRDAAVELLRQALAAIGASEMVRAAVLHTFGTPRFTVSNVKVLMTELGAQPQAARPEDGPRRTRVGTSDERSGRRRER